MKQIYLVVTGDYEYQVHGVFDTEEKALACADQIDDAYVETFNLNCPQTFKYLIKVEITKEGKTRLYNSIRIGWPISNIQHELYGEEISNPIYFRHYVRPAEFKSIIFHNISEEEAKQMGAYQVSPDNPNYYVKMEKQLEERIVDVVYIHILLDTDDEEKAIPIALEQYNLIMANEAWGDDDKANQLIKKLPLWKE